MERFLFLTPQLASSPTAESLTILAAALVRVPTNHLTIHAACNPIYSKPILQIQIIQYNQRASKLYAAVGVLANCRSFNHFSFCNELVFQNHLHHTHKTLPKNNNILPAMYIALLLQDSNEYNLVFE